MHSRSMPLARLLHPKILFVLLLLITVAPAYVMAGDHDGDRDRDRDHSPDYPPYGSHVPTAHFDHKVRPQLTPPAVTLLNDGSGRVAQSEWNMKLVGYDNLDGRSTYQPLVVRQGNRYIAYMAHHAGSAINRLNGQLENNGTSLLDVTDPHHPIYLSHIPGFAGSIDAGGNQMAHVCSGDVLPSNSRAEAKRKEGHYYLLRSNGNSSGLKTPTETQQIWDVTNPSAPTLLTTINADLYSNTHKNWWECDTGIAYLVANDPTQNWVHSGSTQHLKIFNLHDPANPEYIRDFGMVGQQPGSATSGACTPPACEGPSTVIPPSGIHGPISAGTEKNRVYMAYGVGGSGVVQIIDRNVLLNNCKSPAACAVSPSQADMLAPQKGWFTLPGGVLQGGHTSMPIFGEENGRTRNILEVTSEEGGNECTAGSAPHAVWLYDITDEANPKQISVDANDPANTLLDVPNGFDYTWTFAPHTFAVGVYPASLTPTDNPANLNSFCNEGARFGTHAVTELFYPPYYGKLVIASWFTGGVRVWDIRNPDAARPIAYFVPAPNGPYSAPYTVPNSCDETVGGAGGPGFGPGCTFSNSGRNGHTVFNIHTNNPEVDDRGFIYIADRSGTGMHILKLTGAAKSVVDGDDDDHHHHHDH